MVLYGQLGGCASLVLSHVSAGASCFDDGGVATRVPALRDPSFSQPGRPAHRTDRLSEQPLTRSEQIEKKRLLTLKHNNSVPGKYIVVTELVLCASNNCTVQSIFTCCQENGDTI